MTQKKEVYKCNFCGNIVEVLHAGVGELVCCGQPMEKMSEKSQEEGLTEKQKQAYLSAIRGVMDWFLNESRESRVKLRWLLGDRF